MNSNEWIERAAAGYSRAEGVPLPAALAEMQRRRDEKWSQIFSEPVAIVLRQTGLSLREVLEICRQLRGAHDRLLVIVAKLAGGRAPSEQDLRVLGRDENEKHGGQSHGD